MVPHLAVLVLCQTMVDPEKTTGFIKECRMETSNTTEKSHTGVLVSGETLK